MGFGRIGTAPHLTLIPGCFGYICRDFAPPLICGKVGTACAIYKAWQAWCEPATTEENEMKKQIKITRAGYLYINGVKASPLVVTPLSSPKSNDPDVLAAMSKYRANNYRMVNA